MSEPDSSNRAMERVMKLPIGKIVKDDASYAAIYAERVHRLDLMKCSNLLSVKVDGATSLTEECDGIAAKLATACARVAANSDAEAKIRFLESRGSELPTLQRVHTFLRWAFDPNHPERSEHNSEENWEEYFGQKLTDVAQRDALVSSLRLFISLGDQVEAFAHLSSLATLYRGILYGGILYVAGSELDRKERGALVIDALKEMLAIALPPLGALSSSANVLNDAKRFFNTTEPPEAVKAVVEVENYLTTYVALLSAWKLANVQLLDVLRKFPLGP